MTSYLKATCFICKQWFNGYSGYDDTEHDYNNVVDEFLMDIKTQKEKYVCRKCYNKYLKNIERIKIKEDEYWLYFKDHLIMTIKKYERNHNTFEGIKASAINPYYGTSLFWDLEKDSNLRLYKIKFKKKFYFIGSRNAGMLLDAETITYSSTYPLIRSKQHNKRTL